MVVFGSSVGKAMDCLTGGSHFQTPAAAVIRLSNQSCFWYVGNFILEAAHGYVVLGGKNQPERKFVWFYTKDKTIYIY